MVEQSKTVLKMTIINFGKRPRWNLYSAYIGKGRGGNGGVPLCAVTSVCNVTYIYIFIKLPVSSFRMLVTRGQKTHFVASSGNAVDSNWEKLFVKRPYRTKETNPSPFATIYYMISSLRNLPRASCQLNSLQFGLISRTWRGSRLSSSLFLRPALSSPRF